MTCIIGLEEEGKAWIGGDSAAVSNWERRESAISKVFKVSGYTIGYTTSFRMGQLLRYSISYPPVPRELTEEFLVKEFVEPIRKVFKEFGFSKVDNNEEVGGAFLVGAKNKIFQIDCDFQVQHYLNGLYSIGSGSSYALGAMVALRPNTDPKNRIFRSLEIVREFCMSVTWPNNVLEVD